MHNNNKVNPDIPARLIQLCTDANIVISDACWLQPQSKSWIMKHKALERLASYLNIAFEDPVIIEADCKERMAVILVRGGTGVGTKRIEAWSFGESARYNTQNAYPFAMAEKRAKDRVILKLLDLSGDVYSDVEDIIEEPKGYQYSLDTPQDKGKGKDKDKSIVIPKLGTVIADVVKNEGSSTLLPIKEDKIKLSELSAKKIEYLYFNRAKYFPKHPNFTTALEECLTAIELAEEVPM